MICKKCVFYNGRICLWSNRVRFWFDGYNCKHANEGDVDKINAIEYIKSTTTFALKISENFLKLFKL